jgi:hypothetical protein
MTPGTFPAILRPYDPAEAIGTAAAAKRAGKHERTIREWAGLYNIGRRIGGRWKISAPALEMLLAGDVEALDKYLAGDRTSERVQAYYAQLGIRHPAVAASGISVSSDFVDVCEASIVGRS